MKKLLTILFLIPLIAHAQIPTRYHFPNPVVIIDTVVIPPIDPPPPPPPSPRPVDTVRVTYLTLPVGQIGTISNQNGLVIKHKQFTNPSQLTNGGQLFNINDCEDITFDSCYFGASIGNAIDAFNVKRLTVTNSLFANNKTGVYCTNCEDVKVNNNQFINPIGPFARGQAVQFNTVSTSATGQCEVKNNRIEAFMGESDPEDLININNSHGRSGAPIDVSGNILRGGGPSISGGGILIGERGGNYNSMTNNKAYNPGNYIFSMSGGSNNTISNNYGWMDSYRTIDDWSNVGFIIWSQNESLLVPCDNNTFTNNSAYVVSARFGANPFFDGGNCTFVNTGNTFLNNGSDTTAFKAAMAFPTVVITALSEDDLWLVREQSQQFRSAHWVPRPTVATEVDKTISGTSTTLTTSGTPTSPNGGFNYRWKQVSGPATATITNATSQTCNVDDLDEDGVYVFMIILQDGQGVAASERITLTVN